MSHVEVTLERDGFNQPWGLRMVGGVDVGAPLTVARVIAGTASEGVLRVGDVITAIKGQEAASLSHQEASDLFKHAGNQLDLVLARGVANGSPGTPGAPRASMVDGPFGKGASQQSRPAQVGRPPARKFSDTVQSPTTYLPATSFIKPKSKMELQAEEAIYQEHHEKDMIVEQPYRTTPLITPGAKVKRDTPVVASYLNVHPDPQVRGAAPHVSQVSSGLTSMLSSANQQLAKKVASSPAPDRPDSGRGHTPKIIHHQFNTPANLYSQDNMASSIQQQTGIAPQVSGVPKKEFSIQNSETLKMILEEDSQKPPTQHKPKSHVVYDVHEAKATNQPPSLFTNSDKIAQSYSFNKLMWSVDPVERL